MKKITIFFLFFNFCLINNAQIIRGTIYDKADNSKISYASVYIPGTFVGSLSDINGNFELDLSKYSSMPVTVSSIGYYSVTLKDFSTDKPLEIKLTRKEFKISEVVVSSKSLARQRLANMKVFREVFLGKTTNAQSCEITNEKEITFNYYSDRDTLKAFASKPLLINNIALGYKITYFLDKFEYYKNTRSFLFTGSIFFNEDVSDMKDDNSIQVKRKLAYLGSRMHFFRSLWAMDSISDGYTVRKSNGKVLLFKDIVIKRTPDSLNIHSKYLKYTESLWITYHRKLTKIDFLKDEVFFDREGYFDQPGIMWEGAMIQKRTGDQLPYNYIVDH